MKKIIGYKFFKSSIEFEQWQLDNAGCQVAQITPIPTSLSGLVDETPSENKVNMFFSEPSVFVTFWKEIAPPGIC